MSSTSEDTKIDDLRADFTIAVSVLGGVSILLIVLIIGLFVWTRSLAKRLKALEPFVNFKLQRPKFSPEPVGSSHQTLPTPDYDNYAFSKKNLNPIANPHKSSIDNSNFSYGNQNRPMVNPYLPPNQQRSSDYTDLDNRFY